MFDILTLRAKIGLVFCFGIITLGAIMGPEDTPVESTPINTVSFVVGNPSHSKCYVAFPSLDKTIVDQLIDMGINEWAKLCEEQHQ